MHRLGKIVGVQLCPDAGRKLFTRTKPLEKVLPFVALSWRGRGEDAGGAQADPDGAADIRQRDLGLVLDLAIERVGQRAACPRAAACRAGRRRRRRARTGRRCARPRSRAASNRRSVPSRLRRRKPAGSSPSPPRYRPGTCRERGMDKCVEPREIRGRRVRGPTGRCSTAGNRARSTTQRDHLMAVRQQPPYDPVPDEAGGAGDGDPHAGRRIGQGRDVGHRAVVCKGLPEGDQRRKLRCLRVRVLPRLFILEVQDVDRLPSPRGPAC